MVLLGSQKEHLLNQIKDRKSIPLSELIILIDRYDDLEPEDFKGYIDDDLFNELLYYIRNIKAESLWNQIKYEYGIALKTNLIDRYIGEYPDGKRIREVLELKRRLSEDQPRNLKLSPSASLPLPPKEPEESRQSRQNYSISSPMETYSPIHNYCLCKTRAMRKSFWTNLLTIFRKKSPAPEDMCNSAVFAPAKIAKGDIMMVQVYIYNKEYTNTIEKDAQMSDEDAVKRAYNPLYLKLKNGDKVTVNLDMHNLCIDGESSETEVWHNHYLKFIFFVSVPQDYYQSKAIGDVFISVNGVEIGKMSFFSKIASSSDKLNASQVIVKQYNKVFISYSHKDRKTANAIAEAYRALETVDYFYDRHSLSPGVDFEKSIFGYIDNCDLFILCWSKNAEKSEWVEKEKNRAIEAAIKEPPSLRLYPINISPYAAPPQDMLNRFHFDDYDKLLENKI